MNLRRALHLVGAGALTGALLLGSAPTASANDGIRQRQWALDAFGVEKIWQHATGKGVTVAVVDDGVHSSQPDLQGSLLPQKVYSQGHVKTGEEDNGDHGTAMAAIIAAHGHGPGGKDGMQGLAPGAKILPLRVRTGVSHGPAIRYAVDHGAKIINLSFGGGGILGAEKDAVEYAIHKGAIVVAGSGNNGIKEREYPAGYPGVLSVGGLGENGGVWDRSSWGSNISLIAPAEQNVSPDPGSKSGYAYTSGTSDATAFVSASAALVWQAHPDLTAGQVINRLIKSAKPLNSHDKLPNQKYGYGIVRPFRAVTYNYPKGPAAGPLDQASDSSSKASGTSSSDGKGSDTASNGSSSSHMPLIFGVGAVIVVGAVILVVVVAKKR